MKRKISAAILLLTFSFSAFAQVPTGTKPKDDEKDVVRISTNLIQIDVSVTDGKGNPIRDLKSHEIEIYENGKKQDISNFSFVSVENGPTAEPDRPAETKRNEVLRLPGRSASPEGVRRTIALVIDDLSLSFASIFWVKSALKKYVNERVQDGDLVALIRTGGGMGSQQQFTMDKRQLLAAIDRVKFNLSGSGGTSTFAPITSTLLEQVSDSKDGQRDHTADIERQRAIENQNSDFRSSVFMNGTLGAVNYIVSGMAQLPGRKSIVLFSDGISLISRDGRGAPQGSSVVMDNLRRLVEAANRSSVVIYTMDGRGLEVMGAQAVDDWTAKGFEEALKQREERFRDSQDGLRFLAEETGGFAYVNRNNLDAGLRRVMDDQSYYLVGYQPENDTFDPKTTRFNKLEVKVTRPGVKVRYRSGFFGITDEQVTANAKKNLNTIAGALTSPFASNEIPLRLHTLFTTDEKEHLWVKSYLHIDPAALEFRPEPDGRKRATFEIVAVSFGDNGVPTDQFKHAFKMSIDAEAYNKGIEKGLVYQFAFPVKKAGAYQYRVALRDTGTNKIGSAFQFIEVPDVAKKRLTLSGIALEGISRAEWNRTSGSGTYTSDPERDTALRQFPKGRVLRYFAEIYNAQSKGQLNGQMKIFRDGKLHIEGKVTPIENSSTARSSQYIGGITLGADMPPGEYVLQLTVSEPDEKKGRTASQFVEFEIVD